MLLNTSNLKEDFRVRNQITPEKHMARLNEIHKLARTKAAPYIFKCRVYQEGGRILRRETNS